MSDAPARSGSSTRRFTLNSDGARHTVVNACAAYTVLAGLTSLVLGMLNDVSLLGCLLGLSGFMVGLWAQMMSATRNERMVIVVGIVASFVGMGLGFAHGAF